MSILEKQIADLEYEAADSNGDLIPFWIAPIQK
jgi:hypothetical protein